MNLTDYEITLLTKEEYERHKERIPPGADFWWLRSPGRDDHNAAVVRGGGDVYYYGLDVDIDFGVRPALKSPEISNLQTGTPFIVLGNRWVIVDVGFAISQDIITHHSYDADNNNWETSELREWLINWAADGMHQSEILVAHPVCEENEDLEFDNVNLDDLMSGSFFVIKE